MKKSTRITLVVFIIFWLCYVLWEAMVGEVSHQFQFAIIIGLIEINSIVGKPGPMASVKGVIISGVVLTVVLFGAIGILV